MSIASTPAGILLVPAYGGMPEEVADKNVELLAREVIPALKAHDVGGDLGVTYGSRARA